MRASTRGSRPSSPRRSTSCARAAKAMTCCGLTRARTFTRSRQSRSASARATASGFARRAARCANGRIRGCSTTCTRIPPTTASGRTPTRRSSDLRPPIRRRPSANASIAMSSSRGNVAPWRRTASRRPDRRAGIIGRIRPSSRTSCTRAGFDWPPVRAAISACGASAIAGSIGTSASMCRRPCTRGVASIDQHFPRDPLRALSRLAQSAGFLPRAAGRSAAGADHVPHVLARAWGWPVADRPPLRPQAGAAGESVPRHAGSIAVLARALVGYRPFGERVAAAAAAAHHAAHLRRGGRSAGNGARGASKNLPPARSARLSRRRSVSDSRAPQLRRRVCRHGHGSAAKPRRLSRSGVRVPVGPVRRCLCAGVDAAASRQRVRRGADPRRRRHPSGQVQLGPREREARHRPRSPDRRLSVTVLQHGMAGGPGVRAVPEHAGEREFLRPRVRLALAQSVGCPNRTRQQIPAARSMHRRETDEAGAVRGVSGQLRSVAAVVWSERRLYGPGVLFVLFSIGTGLAYPQVIRLIIDEGIQQRRLDRLNALALLMVAVLLVEAGATFARDYCFNLGAERVGARLRRVVFRTLLRQDVQFFDRRDPGEITTRLWADVPALQFVLGEELADALRFSVFAVCGTALLFYTSTRLTLLTLLAVPPIVVATSMLGRRVRALATDMQQAHADAGAAAAEVVGGIRTVRAFSQEAAEVARYERRSDRAVECARRKIVAHSAPGGVSFVAGECAALVAIWVGGNLIVKGRLTTGSLISFVLYAMLVARGFRNASRFAAESMRAAGATEWIFELIGRQPSIAVEGGDRSGAFDGSIAFEHVRFRYPTRPDVEALKGIDLQIRS